MHTLSHEISTAIDRLRGINEALRKYSGLVSPRRVEKELETTERLISGVRGEIKTKYMPAEKR